MSSYIKHGEQEVNLTESELARIIAEAVGYGSLCWTEVPTGVFDSTLATDFVTKKVKQILKEKF